jgi:hypothetical protein
MMTYNKVIKLMDKDNRLLILLGSMLVDGILLIGLIVYAGMQFAF